MITDSDSATIRDDLADGIVSTLSNLIDSDTMLSEGYSELQTNGDFELGALTGWTAIGTAALTTASDAEAHAGDYSCKIDNTNDVAVNGDFETGDLTGWTVFGPSTASATDADSHGGTYSATYTSAYSVAGIHQDISSFYSPGQLITASVWVKVVSTDGPSDGIRARLLYQVDGGGVLSETFDGDITVTGEWSQLTLSFTIPAGTTINTLLIRFGGIGQAYWDDAVINATYSGRTQDVTLTSSATFTATCYALMSEIDTTYRMRLSWTDDDGAHTEDAMFAVAEDWTAYTLTAAIGTGLTGTPTLSFYGMGAGYVDDVTLIRTRTAAELAAITLPGNGVFRRGGMTESERLVIPQHKLPAWVVHIGQSTSSQEGTWGADEQDFEVVIEWLLTTIDVDTAAQEANQALSKLVRMWRKVDQRTVGYGALRTLMISGDGEVIDGPTVDAPIWGANNENDGDTIDYAMVGAVTCTVRLRVARE